MTLEVPEMPVTGRKPKPDGQKRNRVKPVHEWTEVPDVAFEGRKLPFRVGRRTAQWWSGVSTMPHCALWGESDWQFAFDTALIAARLHDGDLRAASELRMREKVLGTTVDFRRDLRIRYVSAGAEPAEVTAGAVTDMAAYRDAVS